MLPDISLVLGCIISIMIDRLNTPSLVYTDYHIATLTFHGLCSVQAHALLENTWLLATVRLVANLSAKRAKPSAQVACEYKHMSVISFPPSWACAHVCLSKNVAKLVDEMSVDYLCIAHS
jgi:hypothetical protein